MTPEALGASVVVGGHGRVRGEQLQKRDIGALHSLSSIDEDCSFGEPVDGSSGVGPGPISLPALEEDPVTQPFRQGLLAPVEEVAVLPIHHVHHELGRRSLLKIFVNELLKLTQMSPLTCQMSIKPNVVPPAFEGINQIGFNHAISRGKLTLGNLLGRFLPCLRRRRPRHFFVQSEAFLR